MIFKVVDKKGGLAYHNMVWVVYKGVVHHLAWLLGLDKLPSPARIMKWSPQITTSCSLYRFEDESGEHLSFKLGLAFVDMEDSFRV